MLGAVPFDSSNIPAASPSADTLEEIYLMHKRAISRINCSLVTALLVLVFVSACQQNPATTNSTTTTNTANVNTNTNATNTNANTPPIAGATIEAREPDKYSATITLKIEAQTEGKTNTTPSLSADFVKNGADRRVAFKVPGDEIVFLDAGNKRYVIATNRKQYAELTPESTGFEVPTLMTPGQMISSVKGMSGCEKQGDEQWNNRAATKYRCAGKSNTGTQAGEVSSETFVYIDKETGLPLRSESLISSSGSVQGIKGVKLVTEMSNIKTEVDASQFAAPQGMSKVSPEQVKQQVNLVLQLAQALAGQLMNNAGAPPNSSATPATSPSAPARY